MRIKLKRRHVLSETDAKGEAHRRGSVSARALARRELEREREEGWSRGGVELADVWGVGVEGKSAKLLGRMVAVLVHVGSLLPPCLVLPSLLACSHNWRTRSHACTLRR